MRKTNGAFTEIWEYAGCYGDTDRDCGLDSLYNQSIALRVQVPNFP